MNTPEPCNSCEHLYYDCLTKDSGNCYTECKKGLSPKQDGTCKGYERWHEEV